MCLPLEKLQEESVWFACRNKAERAMQLPTPPLRHIKGLNLPSNSLNHRLLLSHREMASKSSTVLRKMHKAMVNSNCAAPIECYACACSTYSYL